MSRLRIYAHDNADEILFETSDAGTIAGRLKPVGIMFERWQATAPVSPAMGEAAILGAYAGEVEKLKRETGVVTADVVSLAPDFADREAMRQKFLQEHTHSEDEVRFFVAGSGLFTMHVEDKVYQLLCEKDDLILVPAGTRHWFDMGPNPELTAIRLFNNPEGWVAQFTGDKIASRFPLLEN